MPKIPEQTGDVGQHEKLVGLDGGGEHGGRGVSIHVDSLAVVTRGGRAQHREVAVVEEQRHQADVHPFDLPRVVPAQHFSLPALENGDGIFSLSLEDAAVETRQAHGVHTPLLERLNERFVPLPAVRHFEDLEGLSIV